MKPTSRLALALGTLLSPASFLSAANLTWDGGGADGKYATPANWSADVVPTGADAAFINTASATTVTYDSATGFATTGMLQIGAAGVTSSTLTLASGAGILRYGGDDFNAAARIGAAGGSGTLNVSEGKLQIGASSTAGSASMNLAGFNAAGGGTGTLNLSGGEVEIEGRILFGANSTANTGVLNMSGGTLSFTNNSAAADRGVIQVGNGTNNVLNFDGGLFIGKGLNLSASSASTNVYFNGTEFRVNASGALIGSGGSANARIKNGGLIVDTNGFTSTISRALSDFAGHQGSITKTGSGILGLNASLSHSGGTTVNGGTLRFGANDVFGDATGPRNMTLTANAGTLVTNTGTFTTLQALNLNNATLTATGGASAAYQAFKLSGTVNATGASVIDSNTSSNANNQIHVGHNTAGSQTTFNVAGISDSLAVSAVLRQGVTGTGGAAVTTGIIKTGAGTMTLSAANTYQGRTDINQGKLALSGSGSISNSSVIDIAAGATLDVSATTDPWTLATSQTLTGNGTVLGAATIGGTLAIGDSPGTMTLTFGSDLTLAGGSISIFELSLASLTAGSFDLAQGGSGSQSVTFGGVLNLIFDSGENYADGSLVKIFDFESYHGDFSEVNFSGLGAGQSASFDPESGIVSVVPEPGSALMAALGLLALLRRRRCD